MFFHKNPGRGRTGAAHLCQFSINLVNIIPGGIGSHPAIHGIGAQGIHATGYSAGNCGSVGRALINIDSLNIRIDQACLDPAVVFQSHSRGLQTAGTPLGKASAGLEFGIGQRVFLWGARLLAKVSVPSEIIIAFLSIHKPPKRQLLLIGQTLNGLSPLLGRGESWQQYGRQDGNNGNHDQQLDQRKAGCAKFSLPRCTLIALHPGSGSGLPSQVFCIHFCDPQPRGRHRFQLGADLVVFLTQFTLPIHFTESTTCRIAATRVCQSQFGSCRCR